MVADGYLDPGLVRRLAAELKLRPSKRRGQNFVIDANTVRRIVATAAVGPGDQVLEVGPGLGSLTAGLLATGATVMAVEIEPVLAQRLSQTMAELQPEAAPRLSVLETDALALTPKSLATAPTQLVANLPYNVAVPVLLHCLATFPSLDGGLVMVQQEVADRLVAAPGSKTYGVPSAKLAWYATANRAGTVPATVFWPKPNVESGLVRLTRRPPPATTASRTEVFRLIDVAFAQRRKMLRSALAAGFALDFTPDQLATALAQTGIDPTARGETLSVDDFARLAEALGQVG